MSRALRIAVADDEPDMRELYQHMLPLLGHRVVSVAASGRELVEQCLGSPPDLIITDIKMPDLDGIAAAAKIYRQGPIPVILVSAFHAPDLTARAAANHVLAYLVKPIELADLGTAIDVAMGRFEEFQALHKEAADLRQALEDRKIIEQAKGILMKKAGLDEAAAFRMLQDLAGYTREKLVAVARGILAKEPRSKWASKQSSPGG